MTIISTALQNLRPGSKWTIRGESYDGLEWFDENQTKPTEEEINQELENLRAAEPMRRLRVHRDKLLSEVDWITIRSYNQGVPVPEEWVQYCQALRDLPETAIPILDPTTKIGISGVDWPVKPT